jgi:hypothetical protein
VDLQLYARVLWRFRVVVVIGSLLAIGLAFMSYYNVRLSDGVSVTPRQGEVWRSDATLFVTQPGFPWGRLGVDSSDFSGAPQVEEQQQSSGDFRFADPDRFVDLAKLYSYLAEGDGVRRILEQDGPIDGQIMAEPIASDEGDSLPLVGISATSSSAAGATRLAERQIDGFSKYIAQQQLRSQTPKDDRVVIERVEGPDAAHLEIPRKKTEAIAIFLAAMIVTLASAFVLENLRPHIRTVGAGEGAPGPAVVAAGEQRKRSA